MREECRNQEEGTPKIAMDKGRDELGDSDIMLYHHHYWWRW
jgi:hypothetical protein